MQSDLARTNPGLNAEAPNSSLLWERWRTPARIGWAAVVSLTTALFFISIPSYFASLHVSCAGDACGPGQLTPRATHALPDLGLTLDSYALYVIFLDVFLAVGYCAVGGLLIRRRSDDPMALFVSLALVLFGLTWPGEVSSLMTSPVWGAMATFVKELGLSSIIVLFYLFPDGRFVPRWTRWVALVAAALPVVDALFTASPVGAPDPLNVAVFVGAFGTCLYAQVHRYRRVSDSVQRQQTKWLVYGLLLLILIFIAVILPTILVPGLTSTSVSELTVNLIGRTIAGTIAFLSIPLCIGIAILRYRLFNIDLLINRTLVYLTLTGSIVLVYAGSVGALGALLQSRESFLVSLPVTGLIAVLFQPLRSWLQRGVNRMMYGERDEPYAVLSRLGRRLEESLAPESVLPSIVDTVVQALRLPYAAITLRENDTFVIAAAAGLPSGESLTFPLVYQQENIGQLVLAPRAPGEPLQPADLRLVADLTRQAGIAAHAFRLTTDLQRSRERLVTAREEERRRLRRDLHDGLGPSLAAQTLKVGSARSLYPEDPAAADALLSDLESDIEAALGDIRRLVYNLRPPTLDQLGLVGAIRDTTRQYREYGPGTATVDTLSIAIDTPDHLPSLPAAVEVAAYRIVQEALTNVVRHAHANTCRVSLQIVGDGNKSALEVAIVDNGVGLPDTRQWGVGLVSMRERADELGGTCSVERLAERGTRVCAQLPLSSDPLSPPSTSDSEPVTDGR